MHKVNRQLYFIRTHDYMTDALRVGNTNAGLWDASEDLPSLRRSFRL